MTTYRRKLNTKSLAIFYLPIWKSVTSKNMKMIYINWKYTKLFYKTAYGTSLTQLYSKPQVINRHRIKKRVDLFFYRSLGMISLFKYYQKRIKEHAPKNIIRFNLKFEYTRQYGKWAIQRHKSFKKYKRQKWLNDVEIIIFKFTSVICSVVKVIWNRTFNKCASSKFLRLIIILILFHLLIIIMCVFWHNNCNLRSFVR